MPDLRRIKWWSASLVALLSLYPYSFIRAQQNIRTAPPWMKKHTAEFAYHYAVHQPYAALAHRYGTFLSNGITVGFQPAASPWSWSIVYDYFFGKTVKEDPLAWLRDEYGHIYGWDESGATPANVLLRMRGSWIGATMDYAFRILQQQSLHHYTQASIGMGVMRHRIYFVDDSRSVAQLFGHYGRGLDRLSGGPSLRLALRYRLLDVKNRRNFSITLFSYFARTRNLRSFNYDQMAYDRTYRIDITAGVSVSYHLRYYFGNQSKELIFY